MKYIKLMYLEPFTSWSVCSKTNLKSGDSENVSTFNCRCKYY